MDQKKKKRRLTDHYSYSSGQFEAPIKNKQGIFLFDVKFQGDFSEKCKKYVKPKAFTNFQHLPTPLQMSISHPPQFDIFPKQPQTVSQRFVHPIHQKTKKAKITNFLKPPILNNPIKAKIVKTSWWPRPASLFDRFSLFFAATGAPAKTINTGDFRISKTLIFSESALFP